MKFPLFKAVAFMFDSFAHCELNDFGKDFLLGLLEDGIKRSMPS